MYALVGIDPLDEPLNHEQNMRMTMQTADPVSCLHCYEKQ